MSIVCHTNVSLTNGLNSSATLAVSGQNVSIAEASQMNLNNTSASTTLTLTSGGDIIERGPVENWRRREFYVGTGHHP